MVNLAGCCVYPHGGWITISLVVTSAVALIGTCYGAASCKLLELEFLATQCFGTYFDIYVDSNIKGEIQNCKASIGLYQWLQPFVDSNANDNINAWNDGYCTGYQETMLDAFSDIIFEVSRGFGVFAVLLSFVIMIWVLLLACIQMNRCQVWLFRFLTFCGCASTGLTFLMKLSPVCTESIVFGNDNGGPQQSCRIDHGGYAMIVGVIMWFATFIIAICWLQPSKQVSPLDELDDAEKQLNSPRGGAHGPGQYENDDDDDENRNRAATTTPRTSKTTQPSDSPIRPPREISTTTTNNNNDNRPSSSSSSSRRRQQQERQQEQQQREQQQQQQPNLSSLPHRMPSVSFDSQDNNNNNNTNNNSTARRKKNKGNNNNRITVDDVTTSEAMEVYLSPTSSTSSAK